jgi:hypothetical protein
MPAALDRGGGAWPWISVPVAGIVPPKLVYRGSIAMKKQHDETATFYVIDRDVEAGELTRIEGGDMQCWKVYEGDRYVGYICVHD